MVQNKKRKNKKTKIDTSDYYTEVFSKGKKLKKTSDKEKPILFEKSREDGTFAVLVFAIGVIILSAIVGIKWVAQGLFFFMLGGGILFLVIWMIFLILVALGIIRSFP